MQGIKRELFPIFEKKVHLNTCSTGALATIVKQAAEQYIDDWDEMGAMAWNVEGKWNDQVELARRDTMQKQTYPQEGIDKIVNKILEEIQGNIYKKAQEFKNRNSYVVDDYKEFRDIIENKGGFVSAHWDGTTETELKIKEDTMATIRCIPLDSKPEEGKCILTGKPSKQRVIFAKAY